MQNRVTSIMNDTQDDSVVAVSVEDIVQKRQTEIINEKCDLDLEAKELKEKFESRMKEITQRRLELEVEYRIFESTTDRRVVITESHTLTIDVQGYNGNGRKRSTDRLKIEDCIRKVFNAVGRPILIGELVKKLEEYGFIWSKPTAAYQYLKNSHLIESAGKHGFYQLVQTKF